MPQNSPQVKKKAVIGYGGEVIESGNTLKDRNEKSAQIAAKYKAHFVHPYDDYQIITGQGTAAKQIFEDLSDLDYLVFPIGGGGLASGSILSTKFYGKGCKAIGVQPQLAKDAKKSLQTHKIQPQMPPISIADGLRTSLGQKTFKILHQNIKPDDIILVSEQQIISATQLVMERMKLVIQPSSATVVAAVMKDSRFKGKKVCCIISGGNLDMSALFADLKSKAKL